MTHYDSLSVSVGKTLQDTHLKEVPFAKVIKTIKTNKKIAGKIKHLRMIEGKEDRSAYKKKDLPYFIPAVFEPMERRRSNLKQADFMVFDLDNIDEEILYDAREKLIKDPRTMFLFTSPSGNGLKFGFRFAAPVTTPEQFSQIYKNTKAEIEKLYSLELDNTPDASRACLLSHDPDIFENPNAEPVSVPKFIPIERKPNPQQEEPDIPDDLPDLIKHCSQHVKNYDQWFKCGFALASLGPAGKPYFIELSLSNPDYPDETAETAGRKFDDLLNKSENKVSLKTLRRIAIESGYVPRSIPRNEDAIANSFVERYKGKVIYCKPFDKWYLWNGVYWREDDTNTVTDYARETVSDYAKNARHISDTNERNKFNTFINGMRKIGSQEAILKNSGTREGIRISDNALDNKPHLFNTASGTIDLNKIELQDMDSIPLLNDPSNYLTLSSPVKFDPDAKCERWEQFLGDWFIAPNADTQEQTKGQELINFVQRAAGYSLSGYTSENALFFLYGTGRNGKSTFVETLKKLFGGYYKKTNAQTLMFQKNPGIRNDVAAFRARRFVVASEIEEGQRLSEALIKDLTGNDTITARFLYREEFSFRPEMKIWIYGNHKPVIRGTDEGIKRRIKLIPFEVRIPKENLLRAEEIEKIIDAELSGILNWAIEGFYLWKKFGLTEPEKVREHTAEYFNEMDFVQSFIDECCRVEESENPMMPIKAPAKELYERFEKYAEESREFVPKRRKFYQALEEKGFRKENGAKNQVYFYGIELLQVEQTEGGYDDYPV